ncbi:TRZ/ATZ family hydrolase [Wenzhouxiangella marina]|uniref:5-methylthioadenosine/S-adenosylhomocysteine deaminase n=1 Tax=Wenzhouxiangella marina TaxID=1579979 RepID=A0A0K0XWM7_9GAMM|nr:TRZ/ATZ family hydrolase [Wenzhouxiangella marina]AKS42075.1 5-methylthioadenosine/S-adenosylhomocysteine deaminase [Wenzhouxiangella marina]MBB6086156.1 5-methylthioadenosine/S-adenosylhomocysteine deaminase [Wenzhouxiangella marina]
MSELRALLPEWVVPVCPENEVLDGHAVLIEGDRILDVIAVDQLDEAYPGAVRQALPGCALIPGLINAHAHSAMALMRGLADDLPLMRWLQDHIWPAEQRWVGPDFVRAGSELAIAEMLLGGTTCFNDNYFFPDVTAATAVQAGMRAVLGLPVISLPTAWAQTEDEYFSRGLEVHQSLRSEALLSTAFAPHAPYTVSDSAFRRMRELAEEMDIPIHLHLLEADGEIEGSKKEHGLHPLDRLDRLGLLSPRLLAVHMTQLTPTDMDRVARAGVSVLHCPASNLKLASGICPVAELDKRGVNIAIGTDGAASNNTLDMFAEMRLAALLAKGASGDPEAVPAARALSMATIHGARALGLDGEIGSIEKGKQADLVAVQLDHLQTAPVHHVISQLVYACSSRQVEQVWVAGRQVVAGGELQHLDMERIARQTREWHRRLADFE